jgi:hypothetical protein
MKRPIYIWLASTLTSPLASTLALAAALTVIVSAHADFGPAVDVKVVRDAVLNASLPPGITPAPITVSDVAVVGNFALATYHAGTSVSQQGFCRQNGKWSRIFAGIGGTADLIQAGYPPEVAKTIVKHLEESRGVDAIGRDPQSTADDRKMFGPEGIAAATEHFKQNSRCDYIQ